MIFLTELLTSATSWAENLEIREETNSSNQISMVVMKDNFGIANRKENSNKLSLSKLIKTFYFASSLIRINRTKNDE